MQIAALAILGLVFIIAGFIFQFVLPQVQIIGWALIGLGTIMLTSSFIIEYRQVRRALTSHRGKFGASTTIMVCIFIGIILLVNAVGSRFYKAFDLTGLSQFTLTSQTKDVLAKLDMPVEAICFFVPGVKNIDSSVMSPQIYTTARQYAPVLLAEYKNHTNKLIVTVVDPEQHPEIARKYGISSEYLYQSVVFQTSLGWKPVFAPSIYTEGENAFTSAILQVTGVKLKTIYFVTGHGEANPTDTTENGYSSIRQILRDNLYLVSTVDLVATPVIPKDCSVLIVAGPTARMSDAERQLIIDYLDYGGKAIFLTNPGSPDDIAKIAALWGIVVKNGTIIDPDNYAAPNKDSITFDRGRNLYQLTSLDFPGLTDIEPASMVPQDMTMRAVLLTGTNAWMTDNLKPGVDPVYDATKDFKATNGLIGGIYTFPDTSSSTSTTVPVGPEIVFLGDSDFANNKNFSTGNNGQFLLNFISSLSVSTQLIQIDSKIIQTRKLVISPEQSRFLNISSIGLLPALILLLGVIIWWRRR